MKRYAVLGFALAAIALAIAGQAWACTGQPQVFSVTPLSAVSGAQVTMHGEAALAQTLELRWNGVAGPKLAQVTTDQVGNFTLAFTVPDVAPGIYSLVVVAAGDDALAQEARLAGAGVGRAAFEVQGASGSTGRPAVETVGSFASDAQSVSLHQPDRINSSTGLAVAMGLLGFGAVALFTGFAVATVRRRSLAPGSR